MERIDTNTILIKNSNNIIHHFADELAKNKNIPFATYERKHFLEHDSTNSILKLYCKDDNHQKQVLDEVFSTIIKKIESIESQI